VDRISDETLMAYADEALSPAEMRQMAELVARDAALAARLVPFVVTRTALPQIFSDVHLGPIPSRLLDTVMSAPIGQSSRSQAPGSILSGLRNLLFPETLSFGRALALCGTVLAIAGAGWMMSRAGQPGERHDLLALEDGKTFARGVLARALETAPMLQQVAAAGGTTATPVVTFKDANGQLCRQFEASRSETDVFSGYACRDSAGEWQVGFHGNGASFSSANGSADVIRPADRQSNPELDAAIDAIISGDALDAQSEGAFIANGWKSGAVKIRE
jgi:17 kDa outer membrane surface antigen